MSKAPSERQPAIGPIRGDPSVIGSKQNRRVTIVSPTNPSTSSSSSSRSPNFELTSAKRILRKNMSLSSEDALPSEQGRARSGSSGRVHFSDSQVTPEHAGEILVQLSPDRMHADAHLGFLQEGRRYGVNLCVPRYLGDNVTVARANAHLQLKEIRSNADKSGHEFVLELEAYHDKLVNEEIAISSDVGEFVLSVSARVLGRGKGTPMLKRGIRCVAIDQVDSEMSDTSTTPHRHGDHPGASSGSIAARRASGGGAAALLKQNR